MVQRYKHNATGGWGPTETVLCFVLGIVALTTLLWAGVWVATVLWETVPPGPNPVAWALQWATGQRRGPEPLALVTAAVLAVAVSAALAWIVALVRSQATGHTQRHLQQRARLMVGPRDLRGMQESQTREKAARLRPQTAITSSSPEGEIGVRLGVPYSMRAPIYASFESTMCLIAAPRRGKTTSYVVPMILDAPGAVVTTSNKRDVPDATRGPRATHGTVWMFDPQNIVGEQQHTWFNPVRWLRTIEDARTLASHFAMSVAGPGAKRDSYFEPEGERLVARLLLAANRGDRSLADVYRWVQQPEEREPIQILHAAGDRYSQQALDEQANLTPKQRDGVYGTARGYLECLESPDIQRWVCPPSTPVPEFNPNTFVATRDTLYAMSQEGQGTAGALVAAIVQAVFDSATELAKSQPGGRLDPPLLAVLDEAPNVARIRRLPDLYSHYGSRGIMLTTVMQTAAQGVRVWGKEGMDTLWGASTVRIYAGGGTDYRWLEDLSALIGPFDLERGQTSRDHQGRGSSSRSLHRERILQPDDLAALPIGTALVSFADARPVLVRTRPWMNAPYANQVRASLQQYDPAHRGHTTPRQAQPL